MRAAGNVVYEVHLKHIVLGDFVPFTLRHSSKKSVHDCVLAAIPPQQCHTGAGACEAHVPEYL